MRSVVTLYETWQNAGRAIDAILGQLHDHCEPVRRFLRKWGLQGIRCGDKVITFAAEVGEHHPIPLMVIYCPDIETIPLPDDGLDADLSPHRPVPVGPDPLDPETSHSTIA